MTIGNRTIGTESEVDFQPWQANQGGMIEMYCLQREPIFLTIHHSRISINVDVR